jgi:uncharacterized membrane protein YfcA
LTVLEFTIIIFLIAALAGFLGSLTGLGGGVVIIPALTLIFKVDIHYAIGASLVSVIATSSGAAAAYVKEGYTNIRIGMFLEIATTIGALFGATLAAIIAPSAIGVIFGFVLILSAIQSSRERVDHPLDKVPNKLATKLRMNSTYPTRDGKQSYYVRGVPGGLGVMFVAGSLSGLLGIGSGAFKVLAMDQVMRIPFKVSTTTSNFMIGVTAAASAGIYLNRGYIDPGLVMPVMLGVLMGSMIGAKVLMGAKSKTLRQVFAVVIVIMALEMIYKGFSGRL